MLYMILKTLMPVTPVLSSQTNIMLVMKAVSQYYNASVAWSLERMGFRAPEKRIISSFI
jgi:hypothetical protein